MNENNINTNNTSNEEKTFALKAKEEIAPARRREIIKTLLIIFLAAMLLLTFFSNTIMNRSLSEISTERSSSGKLTETVRGGGVVVSNQSYEVLTEDGFTVEEIKIRSGQSVKKDDVLFKVSSQGSGELSSAEAELDSMQLEYQKLLLNVQDDFSDKNQAIANARSDLDEAIKKRDKALSDQNDRSEAKKKYESDKKEAARLSELSEKLSSTIQALDNDELSAAAPEYTGDLTGLYNAYSKAESEYSAAYEVYTKAVEDGAEEAVLNSAKADSDEKNKARNDAKAAYDNERSRIRSELSDELKTTSNELSTVNGSIADYENSSDGSGMSYEELDADVTAKERALEELVLALQTAQKEQEVSNQIADLDLEAKKKAIDKQKKKVEELKKSSGSMEIKSKYDGVVSSVNVQPNETTSPDMPLAVIDLAEEGYTVEVSVDGEKSAKVNVGAKAEVINSWGSETEAVLTNIKNDTVAGSRNKILVFSVKGDVESGAYLDLSIPCGSANYDTIIPKSAVYEDKDGKFILKVISKNSPFGNRFFAEKIPVDVLASDEISCAVQGGISAGDSIITAASKPVAPGDQVRMKDK